MSEELDKTLAGLDRLAASMDRLAAAMEQRHIDKVGPYDGARRKVTPEEWVALSPREREWSFVEVEECGANYEGVLGGKFACNLSKGHRDSHFRVMK